MSFASIPAQQPMTVYLTHHIRTMLPPPVEETQDEYLRRDNAALALLVELAPLTVSEAEQAAVAVACNAYGLDCLRLAGTVGTDAKLAVKCVAQAASMFRHSDAARRRLAKLKAERTTPAADANPAPAPAQAPDTQPSANQATDNQATGSQAAGNPDAQALAEAEAFASQCPRRAIQIRRFGRVPEGISYTPPRPAVVRALVTGQTPALRKLDRRVA